MMHESSSAPSFADRLHELVRARDTDDGTEWLIEPDAETELRERLAGLEGVEAVEEAAWDLLALAEVCAVGSEAAASTLVSLAVEALERVARAADATAGLNAEARARVSALLGGPARRDAPAPAGPAFSALALRASGATPAPRRRRRTAR